VHQNDSYTGIIRQALGCRFHATILYTSLNFLPQGMTFVL